MKLFMVGVGVLAVSFLASPAQAAAPRTPDVWTSEYGGSGNAGVNAGDHAFTATSAARLRQAWVRHEPEGTFVAPAIVGGVVYQAVNSATSTPSKFVAVSARTGKTLWSLRLPTGNTYLRGQTVRGNLVVLPFDGRQHPGGITVINRSTHKIVWSRYQPAPRNDPDTDNTTSGPVLVDSKRIYMYDASNPVNAFRLSDGKSLWQVAWPDNLQNAPEGAALGHGVLYTGGNSGVTAYSPATGRKLWTAPGWGPPVLAGSHVYSALPTGVVADPARGCGHRTCKASWTRDFGDVDHDQVWVGAATSDTLYVAYTLEGTAHDGSTPAYGRLQRLSAATGGTRWSTGKAGSFPGLPVRAGDTVWTVDNGVTLHGFATNSAHTAPLVTRTEPGDSPSVVQGTGIADGTIAVQIWPRTLVGYRTSGT